MTKKKVLWCMTAVILLVGIVLLAVACQKNHEVPTFPEKQQEVLAEAPVDDGIRLICKKETWKNPENGKIETDAAYYLDNQKTSLNISYISGHTCMVEFDPAQTANRRYEEIPELRSELWEYSGKTYAVVFAMPHFQREGASSDAGNPINPPFAETVFYGLVPADTYQTVPLTVQSEDVYGGYPVWVFVLDAARITDDYKITYGDFYLTGKMILGQ